MLVILLLRFIMQSLTMIVTDAEHIILDNNHTGQLTISATESEGDKNQVFLFKVKCNIMEAIQAKPSHGIILPNNSVSLQLRFKGKITELTNAKLKVYYMRIGNINLQKIRSVKSIQLPQLYKSYRAKLGEDHQNVLNFRLLLNQQQSHTVRSQFRYSKDPTECQKVQSRNSLKIFNELARQKETRITLNDSNQSPQEGISRMQIKQLFIGIFFAFLLGVSFGIKISRMQ